tara:strand:+ start:220 stop:435 length:216 start_codon:yes stop_codon:yes gene_type:complete
MSDEETVLGADKNGWAPLYEFLCSELGAGLYDHEKRHLRLILKAAWDRKWHRRKVNKKFKERTRKDRGSFH